MRARAWSDEEEEMKPGGEKKMTLEEYVDFSVSKNSMDFTISYLNQVLFSFPLKFLRFSSLQISLIVDFCFSVDPSNAWLPKLFSRVLILQYEYGPFNVENETHRQL